MKILLVSLMIVSLNHDLFAIDFKYKNINDFETLSSFKSIKSFEKNYKKYTQVCLDNTGGGSGGVPCFIDYKMWDRELNIYYKKLYSMLNENEKILLKKSQLLWIKERDASIDFISKLLDIKYKNKTGTMYLLTHAWEANTMISPIIKQRTLLLRKWFHYLEDMK